MDKSAFDFLILGAGPAGYTAALEAARAGKTVLLADGREAGGTCLNRGCIPTKALLSAAEKFDEAKKGEVFGLPPVTGNFVYEKAAKHRDATVKRLRSGVEFLLKKAGVTFLHEAGEIVDSTHAKIGEAVYEFRYLILATGSIPSPAPFPVDEGAVFYDSDTFLALNEMPESAVIIGGGVIGIEFATLLSKIGRKVTVIEAANRILPPFDPDLAAAVRRPLEKSGVVFHTESFVRRIYRSGNRTVCAAESGNSTLEAAADCVITAVGRKANLPAGWDRISLGQNRGYLTVDDCCRTNIPNIYAVGDVNGRMMLAHAAENQGKRIVRSILSGENAPIFQSAIPSCVYSDPEIASVGLTEKEALARGITVKTARIDAVANGRMLAAGRRDGFVKLTADDTGKLLGAQIAGPRATDLIAEIAVALANGLTAEDLAETVHPHPTMSEMISACAELLKK